MKQAGLEIRECGSGVILEEKPDGIESVGPDVAGRIRKHLRQLLLRKLLLVDLVGEAERVVEAGGGEAETGFATVDDVLLHVSRLVHPNRAVWRVRDGK